MKLFRYFALCCLVFLVGCKSIERNSGSSVNTYDSTQFVDSDTTNRTNGIVKANATEEVKIEDSNVVDTDDWVQFTNTQGTVQLLHPDERSISIQTYVFIDGDTYDSWLKYYMQPRDPSYTGIVELSAEDIVVGGLVGWIRTYKEDHFSTNINTGSQEVNYTSYNLELILHDQEKVLVVRWYWPHELGTVDEKVIQTIARSVTFTPEASIDLANWSVYTDDSFHYTLSYPPDYVVHKREDVTYITSPKTDEITTSTTGERSDAIFVDPEELITTLAPQLFGDNHSADVVTFEDLAELLKNDQTISFYEESSISGYPAIIVISPEYTDTKYTIIDNVSGSDTVFVVKSQLGYPVVQYSKPEFFEYYDSIVGTLKISNKK